MDVRIGLGFSDLGGGFSRLWEAKSSDRLEALPRSVALAALGPHGLISREQHGALGRTDCHSCSCGNPSR